MEELQQRHRKERRELQGRITQKKKNATKKTRKGVNDECAELERQLAERHQQESEALHPAKEERNEEGELEDRAVSPNGAPAEAPDVADVSHMLEASSMNNGAEVANTQPHPRKPNRQKVRLARRAAEQDAAIAAAAAEAAELPDQRAQEQAVMEREAKARGLTERSVRSDGHCLYAAMADQLAQIGKTVEAQGMPDYLAVRRDAADFIYQHPGDFAPFLEEPLDEYVGKIRDTAEWGGQLELSALARQYQVRVQVLQGDGRVETIGDEKGDTEVWLAYYRHSFGLGEHYNSLRKKGSDTQAP